MIGPPTRPDVWAKADGTYWHPLVAHSADVASVFEGLLARTQVGARLDHLWGGMTSTAAARLCVLAALHDAGKANRRFQNKVYGGPIATHQAPLVYLLRSERSRLSGLRVEEMNGWFEGGGYPWLETAWSHHGAPLTRPRHKGRVDASWDETALKSLEKLSAATREWYPEAFGSDERLPKCVPAQHLFNGTLTLADWIASDPSLFNWKRRESEDVRRPDAAKRVAERRAEAALRDAGLEAARPTTTSITSLLPEEDTPYEVQEVVRSAPAPRSGSLVVLESPTGSGKTEAVLGRFARLAQEGLVDSLFLAAPIRAAAKQLHARVCKAADAFFDDEVYPHLAIPGYLRAGEVSGFYAGDHVRWDEDIGQSGWAAETSKRFTASHIAVGTTDQVLLAALKNAHAHLRLAGLSRSLIVVDEVHASSTYMHKALQRVLDLHRQAGGHAVLMSATLGTSVRAEYTGQRVKSLSEAKAEGYPRVITCTQDGASVKPDLPCPGSPKAVQIQEDRVAGDASAVARRAAHAAEEGARVLVIRNTVAECQATFNKLPGEVSFSLNGTACPHHSRYAAPDRGALDDRVEALYGETETRRSSGGCVTVATQTVQQSLDIDADLLITDLCPMDVLLQRIGRLHRHSHPYTRPRGYEKPHCIVLAPEKTIGAYLKPDDGSAFALPIPGAGSVYSPLHLKAARDALAGRSEITIPAENRTLVEESLHADQLSALAAHPPFDAVQRQLNASSRNQRVKADYATIDWEQVYPQQPFPPEQLPTRLGLMPIIAELPEAVQTPFGHTTQQVPLSPYVFDDEELQSLGDAPDATNLATVSGGFTFDVGSHSFSYTAIGIEEG